MTLDPLCHLLRMKLLLDLHQIVFQSHSDFLKGLLDTSIENQKILQNLVTLSTNKNAQNEEQVPPSKPIQ